MRISVLKLTFLLLISIIKSQSIQLYIPTITSACIHRSNGTYRLNVQWKFDESTDLSEIDEFIIYYMNSSVLVEVYHYPDDKNMDVIIVGKTSASYIPLPDITSTTIQVRVASVRNRAVNSPSEMFNSTECSTELNSSTSVTTSTTTTTTTTTTLATTTLATPITTTAVTSAMPTVTGNEQTVLVSKLPTSSTLPLSPAPSSPTSLSNMSSSNESDDFPIIVVVIAVAIICLLLLFIMIVLIIFIIRLKCKSCKNKDLESEAESVKPLQNGSLLFRQADKVNYLKTPSQIIDSQYNTVQQQSDCNGNASNQSQRYSEAHKYDVPANNKVANNDYDHIDFQYEQADHPFQQSYTNGGPHVTNYEEGPQQKYNVLVHSSSMDKLGKDCPNPPSITTDHYNKLHDNNCANTSQAHLRNDEAYYSVPVNATLSTNNASTTENPHDYDRLCEKP